MAKENYQIVQANFGNTQGDMIMNANGTRFLPVTSNIETIFKKDANLRGLVGFDEFLGVETFTRKPVWMKEDTDDLTITDADISRLKYYLRKHYREFAPGALLDEFLVEESRQNAFHPVRKWVSGLPQWDGKPRLETLFIKFLGVPDNKANREMTRIFFLGALARIKQPGCDFPYTLVLCGKQGIGKTRLLRELFGEYYISLQDATDDPHAVDALQRAWLVELEEFRSCRKSELNATKAFLSASSDTRRFSYERRARTIKRHNIFVATCNDTQFLTDLTGNRRFPIFHCKATKCDFGELTREYVEQVWSEAKTLYLKEVFRDGFDNNKLILSDETRRYFEDIAGQHLQDNGLATEIKAFLAMPVPAPSIWRLLTQGERQRYFTNGGNISINPDELKRRQKARKRPTEEKELDTDIADGIANDTITRRTLNTTETRIDIYGDRQRTRISASELYHELFNSGADKRATMRAIAETLTFELADEWEDTGRYKGDPIYKDVRHSYVRKTDKTETKENAENKPTGKTDTTPDTTGKMDTTGVDTGADTTADTTETAQRETDYTNETIENEQDIHTPTVDESDEDDLPF